MNTGEKTKHKLRGMKPGPGTRLRSAETWVREVPANEVWCWRQPDTTRGPNKTDHGETRYLVSYCLVSLLERAIKNDEVLVPSF